MGSGSEVRVSDSIDSSGYRMVRVNNGVIALTILPEKGADIYSLELVSTGVDVLWKSPWGLRKGMSGAGAAEASSEMAWMDQYAGGWQVIFPNGGAACLHRGAHHGFHGEASIVPWKCAIVRSGNGGVSVTLETVLACSPFALKRVVTLNPGDCYFRIEETIRNYGGEAMEFVWGHHPALGAPFLGPECIVQVPAARYRTNHGEDGFPWPCDGLERVPSRQKSTESFGYLSEFEAGWYAVRNPRLELGFALAWPVETFPYAWLWREFGGTRGYPWYSNSYVMAIEPFSSIPDRGLAHAAAVQTALRIDGGESLTVELACALFEEKRALRSFDSSGKLIFVEEDPF